MAYQLDTHSYLGLWSGYLDFGFDSPHLFYQNRIPKLNKIVPYETKIEISTCKFAREVTFLWLHMC